MRVLVVVYLHVVISVSQVDIRLDDVSLVLPSKRMYEVIYNRLGNDLILWKPDYFRVLEHLYKQVRSWKMKVSYCTCPKLRLSLS